MTRGRRIFLSIGLALVVLMVAARFLRQDVGYLHASHVSEAEQIWLG
jgi:uncharacterized membrane protein